MSVVFERAIPILRMFDVAKAREFYLDYLGFSVDFEHRFADNAPLFMGVSRNGFPILPWHVRELCVVDPFGNRLIFSEPIAS